jgi:cysteine desulfurase
MKNSLPVYLDYAASTPVDPRVLEKMLPWLMQPDHCGNPSATHGFGRKAAQAIEHARQQVADLIHADPQEIIWTSGATEANNLAIKGIAHAYRHQGQHIVTCQTEHEAVIESCKQLEREGFCVTYLMPEKNGLLNLAKLKAALQADTILVAIMHVNNEIGVVQDIAAIGHVLREKNILFHVDAVQSAGKIPIDVKQLPVDLMAFSAHKIYGPKGVGALYVNNKIKASLSAQLHGGGQEYNLRSGTLATHQIIGMGEAFALAQQEMLAETKRVSELRDYLWRGLQALGNVQRNGDDQHGVAGILNVAFIGIENKVLLPALRDIAVSTGSACHASSGAPSRVLAAIGLSDHLARSSIRFSLGRFTTQEEIRYTLEKIAVIVKTLQER